MDLQYSNVKVFCSRSCELSEGPLYHPGRDSLFWVDINNCLVLEKNLSDMASSTYGEKSWVMPSRPSLLVHSQNHQYLLFILAEDGLYGLTAAKESIEMLCGFELEPGFRTNDGAVCANGDLVFGSMQVPPEPRTGSIYRLEKDCGIIEVFRGIGIPNTFVEIVDGKLLISDSLAQKSTVYGTARRNNFHQGSDAINTSDRSMTPDGGCMDSQGNIWVAFWGSSTVKCLNQDFQTIFTVELPVPQVSSCCFGGKDLSTLFITTAKEGMTPEEIEQFPTSGAVFSIDLPVAGVMPEHLKW